MDDHNFVPLLEFGRRPESVRCRVTGTGAVGREGLQDKEDSGDSQHTARYSSEIFALVFTNFWMQGRLQIRCADPAERKH